MAAEDVGQVFERQRQRIGEQGQRQEQQSREAIRRRFAALGGLQSGAGIKAEEEASRGVREQVGAAQDALAVPEAQFKFQQQEAERAGQQFEKQFGLQKSGQDFQREQFGKQFGLQERVFETEKGNKAKELDLAEKTFQQEKAAQAFNTALSAVQAGVPFDLGAYMAEVLNIDVGKYRTDGRQSKGSGLFGQQTSDVEKQVGSIPNVVGGIWGGTAGVIGGSTGWW